MYVKQEGTQTSVCQKQRCAAAVEAAKSLTGEGMLFERGKEDERCA